MISIPPDERVSKPSAVSLLNIWYPTLISCLSDTEPSRIKCMPREGPKYLSQKALKELYESFSIWPRLL